MEVLQATSDWWVADQVTMEVLQATSDWPKRGQVTSSEPFIYETVASMDYYTTNLSTFNTINTTQTYSIFLQLLLQLDSVIF